ncbi:alpha/beta fold hydrolase [Streptomyces phaeochromogenes]|uniref:alpha/beta fold hydrolase n=1 Tax=Streptomyces phaeochromogenes TaxID=1923 RepID=UPI0036C87829
MPKYYRARGENLPLNPDTRGRLRGSFIELSGGTTHYELTGPEDGELVFLMGGLTVPLFYWDGVAEHLHRRGLRTLTYSTYGRGYSDRVAGPYNHELFVRQAHDLVEALDVPQSWHTVGSSMGALNALGLLQRSHEQTKSLTLLGPAGFTEGDAPPVRLATAPGIGPFLGKHLGQLLLRAHLSHNVRTPEQVRALTDMVCDTYRCEGSMYALLATLGDYDFHRQQDAYRQAGRLGVPTLLLWGEQDQVTPIGKLPEAKGLLNPQLCQVFADCGHMVPFEYPEKTAAEMADFFAGLGRP